MRKSRTKIEKQRILYARRISVTFLDLFLLLLGCQNHFSDRMLARKRLEKLKLKHLVRTDVDK